MLFPNTIVVASPVGRRTGRPATRPAVAAGVRSTASAAWKMVAARPWSLAALCGVSGDGHGEHALHELPGMGQKPANPILTNATPSPASSCGSERRESRPHRAVGTAGRTPDQADRSARAVAARCAIAAVRPAGGGLAPPASRRGPDGPSRRRGRRGSPPAGSVRCPGLPRVQVARRVRSTRAWPAASWTTFAGSQPPARSNRARASAS